ncbi:hypothetical protein LKL81_24230 [Bacillus paranthracis]|uniref:hypothetical protein n=1 Tax=Bacillus TaxID=1386 RepID=UPI000279E8D3|nr:MULTISPECIES: hypothetical protein [Bacillus]EJR17899.1 hypothetical protein II9_02101 [Bacillus cereus MSX-D12]KMP40155.1 hypothetical protein TU55_24220 [Bacillus cereus]KMP67180.1 hypothetical protein TU61_12990 [Bacillus cereus]MCC2374083.1 hypothetical protein [Bacillus paranthracis]MCC2430327.1 hypothetical protein [Bacillus paranthracis]
MNRDFYWEKFKEMSIFIIAVSIICLILSLLAGETFLVYMSIVMIILSPLWPVVETNKGLYLIFPMTIPIICVFFGIPYLFFILIGSFFEENIDPIHPNSNYEENIGEDYDDVEPDNADTQHVDPHWVDGYERSDGTEVDGYWRGGDDGYERSNPN